MYVKVVKLGHGVADFVVMFEQGEGKYRKKIIEKVARNEVFYIEDKAGYEALQNYDGVLAFVSHGTDRPTREQILAAGICSPLEAEAKKLSMEERQAPPKLEKMTLEDAEEVIEKAELLAAGESYSTPQAKVKAKAREAAPVKDKAE